MTFFTLFVILGSIGITEKVQAAFSITSEIKLLPSDTASSDYFGRSVSISADTAAVGVYGKNSGKGVAYVYTRSGTSWSQQAVLSASDAASNDLFGYSVSISGDTAVVGAYNKNSGTGAAYVFTRSGASWSQQAKLTASDFASGNYFGSSVSISGDTAVIGAYNNNSSTGAAYVFTRSGTSWSQQAKLTASDGATGDYFGYSVSINGDTVVVGASSKNSNAGASYVFTRSGTSWSQQAKLTASDAASNDLFGIAVSISGDTVVVGAYYKNLGTGAAYVFTRSGTSWSQQAKLTSSEAASYDFFGAAVSISSDTAVVGAYYKSSGTGAAYVFTRSGTSWSQQAKLTASDSATGNYFGSAVSISGGTAIVGAYLNNSNTGAAYIFTRSGTSWSQQAKLIASDGAPGDHFGNSVSISGDTAVVGANLKNSNMGAAYVFTRSGTTWTQQAKLTAIDAVTYGYYGYSVGISGDTVVVSSIYVSGSNGAAYVFIRNGTNWSQQAKLTASDAATNDFFGYSVSISADTAVVGTYGKNSNTGAAYVFTRSGTSWSQQAKLTAADAATSDNFGSAVSISGDTVVGGAYFKGSGIGAVYVFARSGTAWNQQSKLTSSDAAIGDFFGHSVSISGDLLVVGADNKNANEGAAYLFSNISPPVVSTGGTGTITYNSATLNGNLASLGSATTVNVSFEYGTTTAYGNTTPSQARTATGAFSANITGLSLGTTYHFRAKADGGISGISNGSDQTFTTVATAPPSVNAASAIAITSTSATLNGNLTSLGTATIVNVFFEYGTTTAYGSTTAAQAMMATGAFSVGVSGLAPNTTYHYRAKADGGTNGIATSSDMTFTTTAAPPTTTQAPSTTPQVPPTTSQAPPTTSTTTTPTSSPVPPTTSQAPPVATPSVSTSTASGDITTSETGSKSGIPIYVWILVGGAAVAGLVVIAMIINKRKTAPVGATATEPKPVKVSTPPPTTMPPANRPDYTDTLRKLNELRKEGVITEEEFAARKKELLDKMTNSE